MRVELYNLREDLGEQHDLATRMPDKAKELRGRLHAWREEVGADADAEPEVRPLEAPTHPHAAASQPRRKREKSRRLPTPARGASGSGQDLADDAAVDVGQAEVAAGVAVGELLVVEAEQVQDRGVQVVDVDLVLDGLEAELVGRAVDVPPFTPPPASHIGEAVVVVVAAVDLAGVAAGVGSSTVGVRPNSPPQMTSVSSNRPRCFRSVSRARDRPGRTRRPACGG